MSVLIENAQFLRSGQIDSPLPASRNFVEDEPYRLGLNGAFEQVCRTQTRVPDMHSLDPNAWHRSPWAGAWHRDVSGGLG